MEPPKHFIHALADAKTQNVKPKKKKETVNVKAPQLSKAARRFYNQNFKDQPERLSKVLAAAGGKDVIPFIHYYYCYIYISSYVDVVLENDGQLSVFCN